MYNLKRFLTMTVMAVLLAACGNSTAKAEGADDTAGSDSIVSLKPTDDKFVELHTSVGDIVVRLFGDTPRHQANFIKLVNEGFYDNVLFHRVIDQFMIQTGDPDSRTAQPGQMLGSGGPGYEIEAEIVYPRHFHHRGALAAARQGDQTNPQRRSSGSQFYIVTGAKVSPAMMQRLQEQFAFSDKQNEFQRLASAQMDKIRTMQMQGDTAGLNRLQREIIAQVEAKFAGQPEKKLPQDVVDAYISEGGAPHLDGAYTVFGEVVSGMETVEKIEKAQTDSHDRPTQDIRILKAKVIDYKGAAAPDSTSTSAAK